MLLRAVLAVLANVLVTAALVLVPTAPAGALIGIDAGFSGPIVQVQDTDFDFNCTGTLVAPRWVITARHCTNSHSVVIGSTFKNSFRGYAMVVAQHTSLTPLDVNLLQLDRDLAPSDGAAFPEIGDFYPVQVRNVIMYGFGGDVLRWGAFSCGHEWASRRDGSNVVTCVIGPYQTENGDSGGPVLLNGRIVGVITGWRTVNGTRRITISVWDNVGVGPWIRDCIRGALC